MLCAIFVWISLAIHSNNSTKPPTTAATTNMRRRTHPQVKGPSTLLTPLLDSTLHGATLFLIIISLFNVSLLSPGPDGDRKEKEH